MRGSVRKVPRKSGHAWRARLDLPRSPNGQRKQRSKTFDTKREAESWLADINHRINQGQFLNPSEMPLRDYINRWLNTYGETQVKKTTADRYRRALETHIIPELGDIPLNDLTPMAIDNLYTQKLTNGRLDGKEGGLSPTTVRHHIHAPLHRALEVAVEKGMLNQNPASKVNAPQPEDKEMKTFTGHQAQVFLETAKKQSRYWPLYTLALLMGLRRSELLGLRWSDVSLEQSRLTVNQVFQQTTDGDISFGSPKTESSRRSLRLPPPAVSALKEQRQNQIQQAENIGTKKWENDRNLVFTATNGAPIRPRNLYRDFKRVIREASLPQIRFHDLRHSTATLLLEQNEHPKVVQKMLGHKSIQTTLDTYSHVSDELQEQASQKLAETVYGEPQKETQ